MLFPFGTSVQVLPELAGLRGGFIGKIALAASAPELRPRRLRRTVLDVHIMLAIVEKMRSSREKAYIDLYWK